MKLTILCVIARRPPLSKITETDFCLAETNMHVSPTMYGLNEDIKAQLLEDFGRRYILYIYLNLNGLQNRNFFILYARF